MATRIPDLFVPDPVPAGDPVGLCWGLDKPFGDLETPESIFIVFSGIRKGPNWYVGAALPPNGTYELPQNPGIPVIFEILGVFSITLAFAVLETTLTGRINPAGDKFFSAEPASQCVIKFVNEENDIYTAGTGYIYIPKALL